MGESPQQGEGPGYGRKEKRITRGRARSRLGHLWGKGRPQRSKEGPKRGGGRSRKEGNA